MNDYNFDVAFSFCHENENITKRLKEKLAKKFNCFFYPEQQKRLIKDEAEEEFHRVFGKEAQVVVVMYQEKWGKTSWTKIEERAIRNRGFKCKNYDFVIFIRLDDSEIPYWYDKNRIWIDLKSNDMSNVAVLIEAKILNDTNSEKPESISKRLSKFEELRKKKQENDNYLGSAEALSDANSELRALGRLLDVEINSIKAETPDFHLHKSTNNQEGWNIKSNKYQLSFQWIQPYYNTLIGSRLFIGLFKGYFDKDRYGNPKPKDIKIRRYDFVKNLDDRLGWRLQTNTDDFFESSTLVNSWISDLIDKAIESRNL